MGGKNADAAYWYYGKERAQWITIPIICKNYHLGLKISIWKII